MSTIILTGGGTAGHCTPNLALLPYLKNQFDNIYYIGSEKGLEREIVKKAGIPYFSVPCVKLVRSLSPQNLKIPFTLIKGVNSAKRLLDKLKPDAVFSKGGFVALPVVIACGKKNIPVIGHESDFTAGLANKISARYCRKMLTAFPETAKQFKNGEYIGSPIRKITQGKQKPIALKRFGFKGDKPVLLITGGSQGAAAINDCVISALPELLKSFDIIHLCGRGGKKAKPTAGYFVAEYMHDIGDAFVCADACASRAGANSLFEILSLQLPCVLIPLPKGVSRGDQILNAEYFEKKGLAYTLPQENLTPESFTEYVTSAYANREYLKRAFIKNPVCDKSRQISKMLADCLR